jgi:cytochrome P450
MERIAKYGRIFGAFQASTPQLFISDPKVLRKVLVQDFWNFSDRRNNSHKLLSNNVISKNGQDWKDMRSVMSPTFTSGKMKQMLPLMKESLVSMEKTIDKIIKSGKGNEVDSKKLFGCFTLDVIAKCAFATETNAHEDENDPFIYYTRKFFDFSKIKIMFVLTLPDFIKKIFNMSAIPTDSVEYLANVSRQIMENRRREIGNEKRSYADLLQLMMTAGTKTTDKETLIESQIENETHHGNENEVNNAQETGSKKTLTDDEVIANIILVLIAGFETTATTLTYTSYALALNSEVQNKLREEINAAFDANGGDISYEVLSSMRFLDAVISETLRVFPPVTRVERRAVTDYILETESDTNPQKIHLKRGDIISIPIYAIHHDKEFYTDPEEYRPERFLSENKQDLIPYTYLPFVAGPRNCIGMRFALMEAKLAVAHLVRNYRFKRVSKTAVPLDFSKSGVLLQAKEVIVGIEPIT